MTIHEANSKDALLTNSGKSWVNHLISTTLSELKLTSQLDRLDITVPESQFGDYSTNIALVLGKKLNINPVEMAEKLAQKIVDLDTKKYLSEVSQKNGFLNFKFSQEFLVKVLGQVLEQKELFGSSLLGQGQKVLVEYFQPNVAKPLHLGHLRTAIIGDAIFKILASQGFKVESDTHLGDWGTQFGLLLLAYKKYGELVLIEKDPVTELNKLYVKINSEIEKNPELKEEGKKEFIKLEQGDEENRKLWKQFKDWSWQEYEIVYSDLGVRKSDHDWPESFYEDKMPAVVKELKEKGLLVESQGAQIVNLEEHNLGIAVVLKSDGGTTYLLRDLATFIFRQKQGFEKQIYVVDVRQKHTLAQTLKIVELLGYLKNSEEALHVAYGFLTLPEGAMSTRKGTVVGAKEFINSIQKEALKIIEEKNPSLKEKEAVAKKVAAGAVKYFDLSHNLKSDIVFDPKKAISFEGNTGPYLQYTYARIQGILRKVNQPISQSANQEITLNPHELQVLRKLVQFPEVLSSVSKDFLPNLLCNYLFELAQTFNAFYQEVPILKEADESKKEFRLSLITGTAQVLENGLYLLGIETPEEM